MADGVFDTSRVVDGRIVLMEAHIERLQNDAAALGIEVDLETLRRFALEAIPDDEAGALRLTVTRGPGPRGVAPNALGMPTLISKFDPGAPALPLPPTRLMTSDIWRNPTAPSSRRKTLAYTDAVIGTQRAREAGFDDALYLTPQGHAACTSIANIFARFDNALVTPPLEDGVVNGIMRDWLIREAGNNGFNVSVASLSIDALHSADAIYLTNSLQLVRATESLDETAFNTTLPEPLLDACRALLKEA
ncbi:aminotransferase class IV [Henriciella sp.]|uniref:aminotransferase class IV n=1 Tax=Henriciella sp. TaxID=1968823 RepID=UPI0026049F59|nr:aminotransferase class IV [Henriciella sp.]